MDSEYVFLYILFSESMKRHYIGVSHDPLSRLHYHNTSDKGWTQRGRPWKLIFQKRFTGKQEASRWERWIKKQKSRPLIQRIIRGEFDWRD